MTHLGKIGTLLEASYMDVDRTMEERENNLEDREQGREQRQEGAR